MEFKLDHSEFTLNQAEKGIWLVLTHVKRVPPHVGLLLDGIYFSLNITGVEKNISIEKFLKALALRKTETLFLKIKKHPVYSTYYMCEFFLNELNSSKPIGVNETTCLSPIKYFFNEFYALNLTKQELISDVIYQMIENNYFISFSTLNFSEYKKNSFFIPNYTHSDLHNFIIDKGATSIAK
ncbi:MAG: hypothetical protein JSU07_12705 [Bacteroidetes bacterium]|nr:hypothetical protein [Bacteroidota bacterium]